MSTQLSNPLRNLGFCKFCGIETDRTITDSNGKQTLCCSREHSAVLLLYGVQKETQNYYHCSFCSSATNSVDKLRTEDLLTEEDKNFFGLSSEKDYFMPIDAVMGCPPSTVGKWILHGGINKLWCTECNLHNCGAPGCVSCKRPNQIHYCDRCDTLGADHRARNCPNPRSAS
jgi:hypothetical protein